MDMDTLISEVFVRPTLWDKKNKNHHNRYVLDRLWEEVALKLNTTRTVVRNKWKNLRDKFRTVLKSADAEINDYEWKHFQSLLFLKDQFNSSKLEGSFPKNNDDIIPFESSQIFKDEIDEDHVREQAEEDESMQFPSEHLENLDSTSFSATASSSRAASPARKCQKMCLTKDDIGQALLEVEQQKFKLLEQTKNKIEEDADLDFFKSLLPYVRTLSPYDQLDYRMQVMELTQEFVKPSRNSTSSGQQIQQEI